MTDEKPEPWSPEFLRDYVERDSAPFLESGRIAFEAYRDELRWSSLEATFGVDTVNCLRDAGLGLQEVRNKLSSPVRVPCYPA